MKPLWYTFGDIKPRVGRTVVLKLWNKFFAAKYNGTQWELIFSGGTIRADSEDEWTGLQ